MTPKAPPPITPDRSVMFTYERGGLPGLSPALIICFGIIVGLPLVLSLLVNNPAPIMAAAPATKGVTPDVVRTNTYQLDSGQFVRRWIDEEMQLLCLTIQSQYGMTGYPVVTTGITCIPLATTAYGLPAVEIK